MAEHTISEVLSTTHHRERNLDDGGTLYYFKVKVADGTIAEAGKKKPDTPPKQGDRYKNLRQPSDNAPSGALPQLLKPITDFQGGKSGGKSPEERLSIVRQHSQKAAVDLVIAGKHYDLDVVKQTAEELERHVFRGVEGGTPGASPPPPASTVDGNSSEGRDVVETPRPSGALTPVEVLKAKLEHKISPDEFQMLLTEAGVADISEATDAQMVGLMNRIEQQSRKAAA